MDHPKVTLQTPFGDDVDLESEEVILASGERLTTDLVEELVEELHSRVGRPSLTAPGEHSPTISVRIPVDLMWLLDARVEVTGLRRSEIIREALTEYLKVA